MALDGNMPDTMHRLQDATSISPLLDNRIRFHSPRPRLRRFVILAVAFISLVLMIYLTKAHVFPEFFPFTLVYAFHDYLYLPFKGFFWTSWYPWSFMLWVPVFGLIAVIAWAWLSGQDSTKTLQKALILRLAKVGSGKLDAHPHRGAMLVGKLVRLTHSLGLRSDYIATVIANVFEEHLDRLEGDKIAQNEINETAVKQAIILSDVQFAIGLAQCKSAPEAKVAAICDIALLTHFGHQAELITQRALWRLNVENGNNQHALARQVLSNAPLHDSIEQLDACLQKIDQLTVVETRQPGIRFSTREAQFDAPALFCECVFAFFAAPTSHWASTATSVLMSLERMWLSQALSAEHENDAEHSAFWIKRSRLASIKYFHETAWRADKTVARDELWPADQEFRWAIAGASLAAGGI